MNATQADAAGLPVATRAADPVVASPYAPSWLNRLIDSIERLPLPAWVVYGVFAVLAAVGGHVGLWTSGLLPAGSIDPRQIFWGAYLPAIVWAFGHLQRVAAAAFDVYRPVLAIDDGEASRLRYELTTLPSLPARLAVAASFLLTTANYWLDPVTAGVVGYDAIALGLRLIAEVFVGALIILIIYQAIRQLRQVGRLHAMPERVDIFQPRPLYAFSRLTSRIGIVLIVAMAAGAVAAPPVLDSPSFWVIWAPWLFGPPLLGVAVFVTPLIGMHGRLAAEKERVQAASDSRLKAVLAELNEATDARDFSRADGLQKLAAAQIAQRELLAKLHTWPWTAGTLGTLVPALALPVVVFLIQRMLAGLLTI